MFFCFLVNSSVIFELNYSGQGFFLLLKVISGNVSDFGNSKFQTSFCIIKHQVQLQSPLKIGR